jgi:thymidylate synthase (FAD)
LSNGGAKEVARVILPEGLTPSRLYFNGSIRSWIFYLKSRLHESTQKEHRELADLVLKALRPVAPITMNAFFGEEI